jgi:hypothetical protein
MAFLGAGRNNPIRLIEVAKRGTRDRSGGLSCAQWPLIKYSDDRLNALRITGGLIKIRGRHWAGRAFFEDEIGGVRKLFRFSRSSRPFVKV